MSVPESIGPDIPASANLELREAVSSVPEAEITSLTWILHQLPW